jgi:septal ring factor EnvC (AmiA/AmiB activator)
VAVIGALAAGVVVWSGQQRLKEVQAQLTRSQQQVAELESQSRGLNQQLERLLQERKAMDERFESLRKQLTAATGDVEQSRKRLEDLQENYAALTAERAAQQAQVASVTGERDELAQQVRRLQQEKATLQRSVGALRERLTWLDRDSRRLAEKLAQAERQAGGGLPLLEGQGSGEMSSASFSAVKPSAVAGTVELPPIIVQGGQTGAGALPVRGRVLESNAQHQFIVIDQGSMDGIRVGMVFDLLRGGALVGRATAVRVRPKLTACDLIRASSPSTVQIGDIAVQHVP